MRTAIPVPSFVAKDNDDVTLDSKEHLLKKYATEVLVNSGISEDIPLAVELVQNTEECWQSWEYFLQSFKLRLLKEKAMTIKLGDIFTSAEGHEDTKNLPISLNQTEVIPISSKNRDILFIREMDVICDKVQKIICCKQIWDNNGEKLTLEQTRNIHMVELETARRSGLEDSSDFITVIFTSQPLLQSPIHPIPRDILIIHKDNFTQYYGPFSSQISLCTEQNKSL